MFAVSQHRPRSLLAAAIAALALGAFATPALARIDQRAPVNARGTDVAAPDQQSPAVSVNARGTDVAAPDQQSPVTDGGAGPEPVSPVPGDDSPPTITLFALIAVGLGGLAARVATGRRRSRATA